MNNECGEFQHNEVSFLVEFHMHELEGFSSFIDGGLKTNT